MTNVYPTKLCLLLMEHALLFSHSLPYTNAHIQYRHTQEHTRTQKLVSAALWIY